LAAAAPRSPFQAHPGGERRTAAGQIGVYLEAGLLASVTQVATWVGGVPGLEEVLDVWLGQAVPRQIGALLQTPQGLLLRSGPEEFLLVADASRGQLAQLRAAVLPEVGSVTDLSHARCRIRIHGTHCLDTLSKLFAIDLRAPAFPAGAARLTGHHHVPALLVRTAVDAFDILVFTTYALDQLYTLEDAALEYGVSVTR
jgi:sarcosine oxidase subunit gamma